MKINETTNLNAILQITAEDGTTKPVISINSNMVKGGNNLNLNFTITDEITLAANIATAQAEMDSFKAALNEKMVELGYQVTI